MPILRVARAHARVARAMAHQRGRRNRLIMGIWGVSGENGRISAQNANEPPCKI